MAEQKMENKSRGVTVQLVASPEPADIDGAVRQYVRMAFAEIGLPVMVQRPAA